MITDNFWYEFIDISIEDIYFQQHSTTSHRIRESIGWLKTMFAERFISRNRNVLVSL